MPITENEKKQAPDLPVDLERPFAQRLIWRGLIVLGLFLASFTAWSTLAPVESAVVSRGIVSVAGFRKQIQHLEGGIVESIHVSDGDTVASGQLLVSLSKVQPAATLRQLEIQKLEAQAIISRLMAELSGGDTIEFAEDLTSQLDDTEVDSIILGQNNILRSNLALANDQRTVAEYKVFQVKAELNGLIGKERAQQRQRSLLLEELDGYEKGLAKQVTSKRQVLQVRQRLAELEGNIISVQADIGQLEQNLLELRLRSSEDKAKRNAELENELREQRTRVFELGQQIVKAADVLRRTDVVSPIDGVVVNLQIHTREGVVAPGQALLDVLPSNDKLVVDAYIHPNDIDEVRGGMPADVRLTSVSRRSRRPLEGTVTNVSADRLVDPESGEEYYRARVELLPDVDGAISTKLLAGMGAEVFIRTGERSPIEYLLEPITNSMERGLREQ